MRADLVVVGAGPAGMEAALAAARHGLTTIVVDEQQAAGGQVFRRPSPELDPDGTPAGSAYAWGPDLIDRFVTDPRVTRLSGATVWGVFDDASRGSNGSNGARPHAEAPNRDVAGHAAMRELTVAVCGQHGDKTIHTRALVLATGAYDVSVPVPGWTLPGVLTAGGAQAFVKGQRLRPAARVVLAGAHPLLLLVADQLLSAGAEVSELAIARPRLGLREMARSAGAVPGHLGVLRESAAALARLRRRGVSVRWSTIVTAADGTDAVEAVHLAAADADWRPRPGTERTIACDALVLGYGFVPSTELARQLRCRLSWDPPAGGWTVAHDEAMRTSVAGVYAAGEPTGVAGAEQSAAEGMLAGLAVAHDLASGDSAVLAADISRARRRLAAARRFSRVVQRTFAPRIDALAALATPSTLVCRCESVRAAAVHDLLRTTPHLTSANATKLESRAGMGLCQGRFCQSTIAQLTAAARGFDVADVGSFTGRMPVRPVSLRAVAALDATEANTR